MAKICIYLDMVIHNRHNDRATEVEALENTSIKFNYILKNNIRIKMLTVLDNRIKD